MVKNDLSDAGFEVIKDKEYRWGPGGGKNEPGEERWKSLLGFKKGKDRIVPAQGGKWEARECVCIYLGGDAEGFPTVVVDRVVADRFSIYFEVESTGLKNNLTWGWG